MLLLIQLKQLFFYPPLHVRHIELHLLQVLSTSK